MTAKLTPRQRIRIGIVSIAIGLVGCVLAYVWFGWKLLLVIFLMGYSNNLSQAMIDGDES